MGEEASESSQELRFAFGPLDVDAEVLKVRSERN